MTIQRQSEDEMNETIELGCIARDRISGFEGVVTARSEFLNGCVRLGLTPRKRDDDGAPMEAQWFDIEQVEYAAAGLREVAIAAQQSGGPARETGRMRPKDAPVR